MKKESNQTIRAVWIPPRMEDYKTELLLELRNQMLTPAEKEQAEREKEQAEREWLEAAARIKKRYGRWLSRGEIG
jgi:hypothetical protein